MEKRSYDSPGIFPDGKNSGSEGLMSGERGRSDGVYPRDRRLSGVFGRRKVYLTRALRASESCDCHGLLVIIDQGDAMISSARAGFVAWMS